MQGVISIAALQYSSYKSGIILNVWLGINMFAICNMPSPYLYNKHSGLWVIIRVAIMG